MSFDHRHYLPCLRWKQGEYQALLHLSKETKQAMTPLIEVPEIGFDFESRTPKKNIDDHLAPFADRLAKKWGRQPCFVDLNLIGDDERMAGGEHPLSFAFTGMSDADCIAIPVTGFDRDQDYQRAVKKVAKKDGRGICLRVSLVEAAGRMQHELANFLQQVQLSPNNIDLVLDLGAPSFEPTDGFAKAIRTVILKIPQLDRWRTFSMIGTSFPASMAEVKSSPTTLPRHEWVLYRTLVEDLSHRGSRIPTFGDFGINHPVPLAFDMRLVKPAASIRYTIDDGWLILKGKNVRDNGFDQYRGLCRELVASSAFIDAGFSYGDDYVQGCAAGNKSTGNLTTWRKVGTNHHLQKVVQDIASLFAV